MTGAWAFTSALFWPVRACVLAVLSKPVWPVHSLFGVFSSAPFLAFSPAPFFGLFVHVFLAFSSALSGMFVFFGVLV